MMSERPNNQAEFEFQHIWLEYDTDCRMDPLIQILNQHGPEIIKEMQVVATHRIAERRKAIQNQLDLLNTMQNSLPLNNHFTLYQTVQTQVSISCAKEEAAQDDELNSLLSFANDLNKVSKIEPPRNEKCRIM